MESNNEKTLFSVLVYLSLLISAVLGGMMSGMSRIDILARAGYLVILGAVFLMVLYWNEEYIWKQIYGKKIYLVTLAVSVILTGISAVYPVGCYWMLLLITAVCIAEIPTLVISYGFLMISYVIQVLWTQENIGHFAFYLIVGVAVMLILTMIQHQKEIPYAAAILLALSTALQILLCRFDLQRFWENRYTYLLEISSLLFLVLYGAALRLFQSATAAPMPVGIKLFVEAESGEQNHDESQNPPGLLKYLEDGFPLLEQLKQKEDLYRHCYEISRISSLAAREIGCDTQLAAVGGMYHEVGRICPQEDVMVASLRLAREADFPEQLIDVIRQHNTGSEIPGSPEAAIVMLSDCIVSTSEYLKKTGKRKAISDERLVDGIIHNRQEKGSLEHSGITEGQLRQLRTVFIMEERHGNQNDDTD